MENDKAASWIGIGYVLFEDDAVARGLAGLLSMVFSNAPRGYLRIYTLVKNNGWAVWGGPHIVKGELVQLTA